MTVGQNRGSWLENTELSDWREQKAWGRGENREVGGEGKGEKEKRREGVLNVSIHSFTPFTASSNFIPLYP